MLPDKPVREHYNVIETESPFNYMRVYRRG